ncbi:hypothetical protein [Mycobacterium parmense]|uniref:Uncharacterized protein n=1 Tax=Mycobacterium parmense TaxID=185642 RepID=A0A7I7YUD2_9MYCO|nr:hypothetical protein [Mycobacterium parmense]MCV7351703.1 hypothetical protein [Mycobacterium parmense]BBZ44832.1 hypothetical protein MPRM_21130 [Mycobacterium parmense]
MDFEGDFARELVRLAQLALQSDCVDGVFKGWLCAAAVNAIDNPPRDGILRSLADDVCQAVMDWARFDRSGAVLADAVEAYRLAASALAVDDQLNKLRF